MEDFDQTASAKILTVKSSSLHVNPYQIEESPLITHDVPIRFYIIHAFKTYMIY